MNGGSYRRCYDGGDQEFWRSFYRPIYELPLRYHAHNGLISLEPHQWRRIRLVHAISGFKALQNRVPSFVRTELRYFTGDAAFDIARSSPSYAASGLVQQADAVHQKRREPVVRFNDEGTQRAGVDYSMFNWTAYMLWVGSRHSAAPY